MKNGEHLTRAQLEKKRQQAVDRANAAARAWQWRAWMWPEWAYPSDWLPAGTVRTVRLADMGKPVYREAA